MISAVRQIQEKCREQNTDLYCVFVDVTKAFDTVGRDGLWKILAKLQNKFINMVKQFHDGMMARVMENGEFSEPFPVTNGVMQGCVLAPSLFSVLSVAKPIDAFKDFETGMWIRFRTDGALFNLRRLQAKTKVLEEFVRELLFADDCGLVAHSQEDMQLIMDRFAAACSRYGLTISL